MEVCILLQFPRKYHILIMISHQTPKQFQDQYRIYAKEKNSAVSEYGTFAFDAAWLIALGLNKTENELRPSKNLSQFYYKDKPMAVMIRNNIINTGFRGVSVGEN